MLKGFFGRHKKSSFRFKIISLYWEIKYAFQRAYRGYDDTDIFNFNQNFLNKIVDILKDFNKNNVALWWKPNAKDIGDTYTKEETGAIIEEMIEHFAKSDKDGWLDLDLGMGSKMTPDEIDDFCKNATRHLDKALEMFIEYFGQLWY